MSLMVLLKVKKCRVLVYAVKKLSDIPSPAGMSLIKLSQARNNLIIPAHPPSRLWTGMSLTVFYSVVGFLSGIFSPDRDDF